MTNDDDFKKARDVAAALYIEKETETYYIGGAPIYDRSTDEQKEVHAGRFKDGANWAREYCAKEIERAQHTANGFAHATMAAAEDLASAHEEFAELKSAILDLAGALLNIRDFEANEDDWTEEMVSMNNIAYDALSAYAPLLKRLRER